MTDAKKQAAIDDIEELIDLRSIWFGLRRRAALFVGVLAMIIAAVAAYAFLSTKQYTAEASLIIEPKTQVFAYGSEVLGRSAADPTRVDTEVELLRSRAMADRVSARVNDAPALGSDKTSIGTASINTPEKKDDFYTRRLGDIAADLAALQSRETPLREFVETAEELEKQYADEIEDAQAPDALTGAGEARSMTPATGASETPSASQMGESEVARSVDLEKGDAGFLDAASQSIPEEEAVLEGGDELRGGPKSENAVSPFQLMKNLEIQRVGSTFLIKIRYTHPSPEVSAKVANAYAEEYILQQLEAQYDELRQANKWIDARLITLREDVRRADAAAATYRAEQGLVDVTGESFSEKALTRIATELALARTNLASLQARYETARRMSGADAPNDAISEIRSSPIVADLRRQQVTLERKLAELKVRYGDRHPEVLRTREEYAELTGQLRYERGRVVESLRSEVNFAAAQVRSLEQNLEDAQGEMALNNEALVTLMELERDIDASRGVYEALLNRQKELNERDQLANANARIIARAETPSLPSKPRKKLILAGGVLLGLIFAGASAFAAEALDTRVRNTHDLRREFGPNAPVVLVPWIQSKMLFRQLNREDVVRKFLQEEPDSLFSESMRDLVMHFRSAQRTLDRTPIVSFTSVFHGEGTSTTAFAFASQLASNGKSVAFIDYSSERPDAFRRGGGRTALAAPSENAAPAIEALGEARSDETELEHERRAEPAMYATVVDRVKKSLSTVKSSEVAAIEPLEHQIVSYSSACGVDLMSLDSRQLGFADLEPATFDAALERLRGEFDCIVIDAPSVLAKSEAGMVAAAADFTFLLMEWCATSRGAARAATQRLIDMHATILSFVVTKVDARQRLFFRPEDRQFYFRAPE